MLDELNKRAQSYIQTNQLQQARQLLMEIISNYPDNAAALNDLAVVEIMEGKLESGLELLNEVMILDPKNEIVPGNIQYVKEKLSENNFKN